MSDRMDPLVVGLDLGTTLCKASAFELDGSLAGSAQKTIQTYRPQDGWAEQDPLEWQQAIIEVLAQLVAQLGGGARRIAAIDYPAMVPVSSRSMSISCRWGAVPSGRISAQPI
jgi:sugar (pentulose or hexulose) kinase